MNYGLGLSNLTSLDKSYRGEISQKGAFTIVAPSETRIYIPDLEGSNEHLKITGFHFIGVRSYWRFRFLRWLATRWASHKPRLI